MEGGIDQKAGVSREWPSKPKIMNLFKRNPAMHSKVIEELYEKYGELHLLPWNEPELSYVDNFKTSDNKVYTGQVDSKHRRNGLGILIQDDKSMHIGFSKRSSTKGPGRLFSINGNVYEGKWKGKYLRGSGTIYFGDGRIYIGDMLCNIPNGIGTLELPEQWVYSGGFIEGFRQGKGTMNFKNKDHYEGEFHRDKMQGNGCFQYSDGSTYKGEMRMNKMHGKGVYTCKKKKYTYEGFFADGLKEGKGSISYSSGYKFAGHWRNDKKDGKGEEIREDGLIVEGLWKNGALIHCYNDAFEDPVDMYPAWHKKTLAANMKELNDKVQASRATQKLVEETPQVNEAEEELEAVRIEPFQATYQEHEIVSGLRVLSKITTKHSLYLISKKVYKKLEPFEFLDPDYEKRVVKYRDEWTLFEKDGVYKGEKDVRNFSDGRGVLLQQGRIYQGFFSLSKRHGIGREIFPNGSWYEGYWFNNEKHGFGVERSENNTTYIGEWFKNNGDGVMTTNDWIFEGKWQDDMQEGQGEIFYRDKSKFKGEFHLGKQEGFGCLIDRSGKAVVGLWRNGIFQSTARAQDIEKNLAVCEQSVSNLHPADLSKYSEKKSRPAPNEKSFSIFSDSSELPNERSVDSPIPALLVKEPSIRSQNKFPIILESNSRLLISHNKSPVTSEPHSRFLDGINPAIQTKEQSISGRSISSTIKEPSLKISEHGNVEPIQKSDRSSSSKKSASPNGFPSNHIILNASGEANISRGVFSNYEKLNYSRDAEEKNEFPQMKTLRPTLGNEIIEQSISPREKSSSSKISDFSEDSMPNEISLN